MPAAEQPLPATVVLAGGRSTRMGTDKALLKLGGKPLVAHVVERLRPQAGAVAVNANGDPSRFAALGVSVLADTVADFPGPLAGLLAGMEWAKAIGSAGIVTVPTDSPFIPRDLVVRLTASHPDPAHPLLAASCGRRHPVAGLWPVMLAGALRDFLAAGETYRVSVFADRCGAVSVDFPAIELDGRTVDPFFNVNTPEDFALAETILKELQP